MPTPAPYVITADGEHAAAPVDEPGVVPRARDPAGLVHDPGAVPRDEAVELAVVRGVREEVEEIARIRGREG